jgi:tetratricopeptide (TPR) repeat protein
LETKDKSLDLAQEMRRSGRPAEAIRICHKLLRRKPTHHRALILLAHAALDARQLELAVDTAERLTKLRPDDVDGWNLLGRASLFMGKASEGKRAQQRATEIAPTDSWAWAQLGLAHKMEGNNSAAMSAIEKAHRLTPEIIVMRYNYALALMDELRADEAEPLCLEALEGGQGHPDIEHALGLSLITQEKPTEAAMHLRGAVKRHPQHQGLRAAYGGALAMTGEGLLAAPQLREALRLDPNDITARDNLVKVLNNTGRIEEALEELERLRQTPGYQEETALRRGMLLSILGRHEEATEIAEQYVDDPEHRLEANEIIARGAARTGATDTTIERIRNLFSEVQFEDCDEQQRERFIRLEFALGTLLDRQGKSEDAFAAYADANRHRRRSFDRADETAQVDRLIATYSQETFATLPHSSSTSPLPVFIVGMPRSGTSLLEQMLDCHPDVFGAGELNAIPNYLRELEQLEGCEYPEFAADLEPDHLNQIVDRHLHYLGELAPRKRFVIDKLPSNYRNLGFISQLLPGARIIHCTRNPQATGLSIFFQNFSHADGHRYANDLGDIGFTYRQYLRLMDHWEDTKPLPIHTVRYEDVIADPERETRALCEFLKIPWDSTMLRFDESQRVVVTASNEQVRQRLYDSALAHWKRYASQLEPFERELNLSS